jgi:hypothetical protein
MRHPNFTKSLILIAAALLIASCSSVNPDSPFSFVDPSGNHPEGWYTGHGSFAAPDGAPCVPCHGDDLSGGVTGVSCSSGSYNGQGCHTDGPAFHPADWLNKTATGSTWHADSYQDNIPINGNFCVDCHTPPALDDPVSGKCLECHFSVGGMKAPAGWAHGASGHQAYAGSPEEPVCVACHEINSSFGQEPFCHNCHETHPDADWDTRALHGVAAKRPPGPMAGFAVCAQCHGDDYAGDSGVTCLSQSDCHNVDAPHPSDSRWKGESTPTHTNTSQVNAPECFKCHEDGNNSGEDPPNPPPGTPPGCFNNTLCHADED